MNSSTDSCITTFISYSWHSEEDSNWLLYFINLLKTNNIIAYFDRDVLARDSEMHKVVDFASNISRSDYFIRIIEPKYFEYTTAENGLSSFVFEENQWAMHLRYNTDHAIRLVNVILRGSSHSYLLTADITIDLKTQIYDTEIIMQFINYIKKLKYDSK